MTDDQDCNSKPETPNTEVDALTTSDQENDHSGGIDPILEDPPIPFSTTEPLASPTIPSRTSAFRSMPINAPTVVLTVLVTVLFLMILLIEPTPRWLVLFGSTLATLSLDGILRTTRRQPFATGLDTTPYLFLPALFVLATPVFLEHNVRGYWAVPVALTGGLLFGAIAVAQVGSVREFDPARGPARFIAVTSAYFVAFALYSLTYRFDLELSHAMVAVTLVSSLLAIEVLREGEVEPLETFILAIVTALIVSEVRWALHFLPLDGHLAAMTLLLTFYFVTGLLHSYLTRQLSAFVATEYVLVTSIGMGLVTVVRVTGIA